MATGKRYYWIKLKDSFMSSDTIDYLMGQPDGANYVVLYQMLCLKTINTGGRLAFQIGDMIIPYDVEKIQRECKWFSLATVRVALEVYKQLGLIYEDKDSLTGKHSRWEIWEDFVTLTAIEISNSTDKVNAPERTKMYQTIVSKYSAKEREGMAEMLGEVIMGMEQNPDQDFLGSLYMMCELGNDHAGQFFTP